MVLNPTVTTGYDKASGGGSEGGDKGGRHVGGGSEGGGNVGGGDIGGCACARDTYCG